MELFSYENIGWLLKYSQWIFLGILGIAAIIFIIGLVKTFKEIYTGEKVWTLITTILIAGVFVFFGFGFNNYTKDVRKVYEKYQAAYENNEVLIASGAVENFTPATNSKSFTLGGVEFKIYAVVESSEPVIYYTYSEGQMQYSFIFEQIVYTPGECVVLGDNQKLEIHYIVEDGENHILYIKEIE